MECRRLGSAEEVIEPLARRRPRIVADRVAVVAPTARRARYFGALPEDGPPLTLAESINRTLAELLAADPSVLVFGEDVGAKGGVYGVTRGLQRMAGADRVFDTLLDEQTILGLALGAGVSGMLPIPEIQYLAYVHNAIDQLRGEAATLSFFSTGQYVNPMVVRIAGYGYQKGFGGHFHNDNALGGLRDLPGVVVASPASRVGCRGDAAHVCCGGEDRRHGVAVRRADRPVPHPGLCTPPATTAGCRRTARPGSGRVSTCRSAAGASLVTGPTC